MLIFSYLNFHVVTNMLSFVLQRSRTPICVDNNTFRATPRKLVRSLSFNESLSKANGEEKVVSHVKVSQKVAFGALLGLVLFVLLNLLSSGTQCTFSHDFL